MAAEKARHVWLASYPKSGNTWMRVALACLRDAGGAVDINRIPADIGFSFSKRALFDQTLEVDSSNLSPEETLRLRPRFWSVEGAIPDPAPIWKVHDAWNVPRGTEPLFPPEVTAATLYLVRDPRDVAVSWAHHLGASIDEAIAIMADDGYWVGRKTDRIAGQLPQYYSSWSGHVESWLDRSGLEPLVIRYEDMVRDLASILARVAALLNWPASAPDIGRAVNASRFESLRNQEREKGFDERAPGSASFFRCGVAGGWRDTLTPAQIARIEHDHQAVMARLGYL